jgi:hypothetical protein
MLGTEVSLSRAGAPSVRWLRARLESTAGLNAASKLMVQRRSVIVCVVACWLLFLIIFSMYVFWEIGVVFIFYPLNY